MNHLTVSFSTCLSWQKNEIKSPIMNEQTTEEGESRLKNPEDITFLDADALSKFVTDTGKILPRKYTGLTPKQQRRISRTIKTSRHLLLVK
jgi:small subunit ribosomal protein S18